MNENKGYDFLNDGNFDISSYDRQDLNEFEKAKLKRDIHKSIKKDTRLAGFNKKIVAAGLVMMILVGLYQVPSVKAYTMDIIEDNIYFARDRGTIAKGREAIAMEAQTLPDAVNHTDFGDIILEEGHSVSYEIGFQYFNSSK